MRALLPLVFIAALILAAGTYHEHLLLPTNRTLAGESGAALTTIDGDGTGRIIDVSSGPGTVEIRGFTRRNGYSAGDGAAIRLRNLTASVRENVFQDIDSDDFGGAIYAIDTSIELADNTFERTHALEGAGIYLRYGGGEIAHNVFRDGFGDRHSGGIYLYSSSPTIHHNLIVNCSSGSHGGGIDIGVDSAPLVTNNTIVGCSSTLGGGIHVGNETGVVVIANNIVVGSGTGYGIYDDYYPGSLPPDLACNDVWNNLPGDYYSVSAGPGDISADPLFCDPPTGQYTISSDSPCAPAHQPSCGLMGALPVACGSTATEGATWGAVKTLFRD